MQLPSPQMTSLAFAANGDGTTVCTLSSGCSYLVGEPVPVVGPGRERQLRWYSVDTACNPGDLKESMFNPATVVHWNSSLELSSIIDSFTDDKEFNDLFLRVLIFAVDDDQSFKPDSVRKSLAGFPYPFFFVTSQKIPQGPYFVRNSIIHSCWRLFPDTYEAFQLPTTHIHGTDQFRGVTIMQDGVLMVPVPSRLYFPKTPEKPLNGLRVTVKDIIDLKGVQTTGQSRSYAKLYGPRDKTASIVMRLIKLGAVVIGKTKCTQFASSDQPTPDWVDYHCPWNPRGDGYLSPRGSSTGTCVALAGYEWCDLGIGTDTGGSIRGPAAVMGLFALRPTQIGENMEGILPIIHGVDTPGISCRSTEVFHQVTTNLFPKEEYHLKSRPTRLLYPTDYWAQWPEGSKIREAMELAVTKLEKYLGIQRVTISLSEQWLDRDPSGDRESLATYLENTFMHMLWKGYWDNLKLFRQEYENKYGVPPYVHPTIRSCWRRGENISSQEMKTAEERMKTYSSWLKNDVFGGDGFSTIMVYPAGDFMPFYRDVYRGDPEKQSPSYDWKEREDHQSSLAGIPSIVVPVDQVPQPSKITGGDQNLPVAISLMSAHGTDSYLTGLVEDMAKDSYFKKNVNVGKVAFA